MHKPDGCTILRFRISDHTFTRQRKLAVGATFIWSETCQEFFIPTHQAGYERGRRGERL
jgi:hypothetical protein